MRETTVYGRPWQSEYVWKITAHGVNTWYRTDHTAVMRIVRTLEARGQRYTVRRYKYEGTETP